MKKYTYTDKGFMFERISKKAAKVAYYNGLSIVVCPVNLRPGAPWFPEMVINRKDRGHLIIDEIGLKNDFRNMVNSFEYYNCINSETGRYAAFYIPVEYVDRFTGEKPIAGTLGTLKQYDYKFMEV